MLKRNLDVIGLIVIIGVLLLWSVPIDQRLAILPYSKSSNHFYGEVNPWCKSIYFIIPWITALLIVIPIFMLVFAARFKHFTPKRAKKFAISVLLSLLIGPGLLVNGIFKDNWGRPRPYQVIRDGQNYKPFWQPDFIANKDNSFPSGHASIGFFLGVPLLALGYRKRGLLISCIGGGLVGYVRILQGGHYLSDVLFAGIFVWLSAELVIYLVNSWYKKGSFGG